MRSDFSLDYCGTTGPDCGVIYVQFNKYTHTDTHTDTRIHTHIDIYTHILTLSMESFIYVKRNIHKKERFVFML